MERAAGMFEPPPADELAYATATGLVLNNLSTLLYMMNYVRFLRDAHSHGGDRGSAHKNAALTSCPAAFGRWRCCRLWTLCATIMASAVAPPG